MNKKLVFLSALVLSATLMTGCTQHQAKNTVTPVSVNGELKTGEVMIPNDAIRFNNQLSLPAENKEGTKKVTIQKVFYSALGQRCIVVTDDQATNSVLCEARPQIFQAYPALAM